MRTITYFKENGLEGCIHYGTFRLKEDSTHEERVEYAKEKGVPDDWTHCVLSGSTLLAVNNIGHFKDPDTDEEDYWYDLSDDGEIKGCRNTETSADKEMGDDKGTVMFKMPERLLSAPSAHELDTLFEELKFGRPALEQKFLDGCIAMYNNLFDNT